MEARTLHAPLDALSAANRPQGIEIATLTTFDIPALAVLTLEAYDDAVTPEALLETSEELRLTFEGAFGATTEDSFVGAWDGGTLIGAILDRLGSADTVTSPTFALVNQYDTADGRPVFHFDFYRIARIEEAYDFGYEEYFYSGNLSLVEWPEKIEELLPDDTMTVRIRVDGPEQRTLFID